ncbi:hypothetical protein AB0P19_02405 [Microbacterium oleivorans]|uniref:hypothetical protein n=1 Tax=Microbacterium oleivorans TaxID=273677 RepID=UPI0034162DFB
MIDMTQMDEAQALVTSIGEFTLDALGRDRLNGLWVSLDPRTARGDVVVALADNSDAEQKAVLLELFDVEAVYMDEVVLTFRFVDGPDAIESDARQTTPIYAYA